MATKLYVGSLSFGVNDDMLKELFATVGEVVSANVITDKFSGQSRGFGFVEMTTEKDAKEAIAKLNNKELDGRAIAVSEAREKADRPQKSFNRNAGGSRY